MLQAGSSSRLTWLIFLGHQEMEEVVGLPWRWGTGWVCWAVPANLQLCLSVKPVHEVLSSEWWKPQDFWGETQDFTAWALHLQLILPGFARSRYQNPTNPRGGFLQTAFAPQISLPAFPCFPCTGSGIKSWLETYSFNAWISSIFSARGSSFFSTVLLLACWESLIVHKSFSHPPKLMIFPQAQIFD